MYVLYIMYYGGLDIFITSINKIYIYTYIYIYIQHNSYSIYRVCIYIA